MNDNVKINRKSDLKYHNHVSYKLTVQVDQDFDRDGETFIKNNHWQLGFRISKLSKSNKELYVSLSLSACNQSRLLAEY